MSNEPKKFYSNKDGELITNLTSSGDPSELIIKKPGYEIKTINPYKGDGSLKSNLGPIELTPINKGLELDQIEASQLTPEQIEKLFQEEKTLESVIQKRLTKLILTLTATTIPFVLKLNSSFGLTKMAKLDDLGDLNMDYLKDKIICPTKPQMDKIIFLKNKITKQLNNSYELINSTTKTIETLSISASVLTLLFTTLKNSPTPTAIAGVGIPVSVVNKIDDNKDDYEKKIKKLNSTITGTTAIVTLTSGILSKIIKYLSILDQSIQQCYPDSEQDQENISAELTTFTQQQSQQLSSIVNEVNGFKLEVETEKTTNSLKRRRAIAKNQKNVVMLKGEWSFSSIDQILIDELIFYIEQNNLKAD